MYLIYLMLFTKYIKWEQNIIKDWYALKIRALSQGQNPQGRTVKQWNDTEKLMKTF